MVAELAGGTLIDHRYQVQSSLGQGGFGHTYLVADTRRYGELCVLKEFTANNGEQSIVEKSRELFQREAKSLYDLNHPQIPKFHASFEEDGRFFIVQEFVPGKTYWHLLQERQQQGQAFTEAEVFQWLQEMLPVLDYLHSRNIIHRDISPDNIMLPDGGKQPVLIDFGVVKHIVNETQAMTTGSNSLVPASIVGKVGYAPMEQLRSGNCSAASDLYALGVTAVVLLTGKDPSALMDSNLDWHWRSMVSVNDAFADVLDKLLADRPSQRYQAATSVIGDMAPLAATILPPPDPLPVAAPSYPAPAPTVLSCPPGQPMPVEQAQSSLELPSTASPTPTSPDASQPSPDMTPTTLPTVLSSPPGIAGSSSGANSTVVPGEAIAPDPKPTPLPTLVSQPPSQSSEQSLIQTEVSGSNPVSDVVAVDQTSEQSIDQSTAQTGDPVAKPESEVGSAQVQCADVEIGEGEGAIASASSPTPLPTVVSAPLAQPVVESTPPPAVLPDQSSVPKTDAQTFDAQASAVLPSENRQWQLPLLLTVLGLGTLGMGLGAISSLSNPESVETVPLTLKQTVVQQQADEFLGSLVTTGQTQMRQGQYLASIATLRIVPASAPGYAEAQELINQESDSRLQQAIRDYEGGRLETAIREAEEIISGTPAYLQAQDRLPQWREQLQILLDAEKAIAEERWRDALDLVEQLEELPFYETERVQTIKTTATEKLTPARPSRPPSSSGTSGGTRPRSTSGGSRSSSPSSSGGGNRPPPPT